MEIIPEQVAQTVIIIFTILLAIRTLLGIILLIKLLIKAILDMNI